MDKRFIDPEYDLLRAYLDQAAQYPLLSSDEEATLAKRVADGDGAARDLMLNANLRLVIKFAQRYKGFAGASLSYMDLISEGNIGLMKAVDRFDPAREVRFSTYAAWWITHAIDRAILDYGRTVRIPVHVGKEIQSLRKARSRLTRELGRDPSKQEIADDLGISVNKVYRLLEVETGQYQIGLDTSASSQSGERESDDDLITIQHLASEVTDHETAFLDYDLFEWLADLIGRLPEPYDVVLFGYFGIRENKRSLQEMAEAYGTTISRIRTWRDKGLRQLHEMMLAEGVDETLISEVGAFDTTRS